MNETGNFLASRLNANGTLDTSFGTAGHSTISTGVYEFFGLQDFALQADGKIVLTGDSGRGYQGTQSVGAARMLAGGGGDTSFNANGTPGLSHLLIPNSVHPDDPPYFPSPGIGRAIRVQPDGKILVATRLLSVDFTVAGRQSIIVRFNTDGTVDSSYGSGGIARTNFAGVSQTRAMDLDTAGRAVLVAVGFPGVQLARFDTNGALDPTFGTDGMASYALPAGISIITAPSKAIVLPNGKILTVMNANRASDGVLVVMRFDANGRLDTAFGDGGFSIAVAAPENLDGAFALDAAVMTNGHIVLAASTRHNTAFQSVFTSALVRFLPNGTLDSGFGPGGIRYYPNLGRIEGIDAQNDGSLLLSGSLTSGGQRFGLVAKTVAEASPGLNLLAVKSGKTHGTNEVFYLPIAISQGPVTVEPRAMGAAHTLVFQFDGPINSIGGVTAEDAQAATVGVASATRSGSDVIVSLTDVPDIRRVKVSLSGLNGTKSESVSLGFLVGDVDSSRSVDHNDVSATRAQAGQTTNSSNFRFDLNATGKIGAADIAATKARSGQALP